MSRNVIIRSYMDLRVYKNLYESMKSVMTSVITSLPRDEKYDLVDQIRRSSKAAPALIAEGYAKRFQPRSWRRYIDDTMGECNEMMHHLRVCIDIYPEFVDINLCNRLIGNYDMANKQLYRLKESLAKFHNSKL